MTVSYMIPSHKLTTITYCGLCGWYSTVKWVKNFFCHSICIQRYKVRANCILSLTSLGISGSQKTRVIEETLRVKKFQIPSLNKRICALVLPVKFNIPAIMKKKVY